MFEFSYVPLHISIESLNGISDLLLQQSCYTMVNVKSLINSYRLYQKRKILLQKKPENGNLIIIDSFFSPLGVLSLFYTLDNGLSRFVKKKTRFRKWNFSYWEIEYPFVMQIVCKLVFSFTFWWNSISMFAQEFSKRNCCYFCGRTVHCLLFSALLAAYKRKPGGWNVISCLSCLSPSW